MIILAKISSGEEKLIAQLEQTIREYINGARRQSKIMAEPANWNKLCSALDLVGDTELAIHAYPTLCSTEGEGPAYLIVYGLLQTLLLQQDAAKHIAEALGLKNIKLPKQLDEVRIVRNSAAGHPTSQKENGSYKSCFISRFSLSPVSFQLITSFSDSTEYKVLTVNLPSLLDIHKQYVSELLQDVVRELGKQEMEHRKMHKDNKLADIFPQTLSYHIGKIAESTQTPGSFLLGKSNLDILAKVLSTFQSELEKRSEWGVSSSISFHYEQLEYPMTQLFSYFDGTSDLNDKDAYIFISFVEKIFNVLQIIAAEIDSDYNEIDDDFDQK